MKLHLSGIFVVYFALSTGCSMGGTYAHPFKTQKDLKQDVNACNEYAARVFQSGAFSEYQRLIDECLNQQYGWKKIAKPS